MTGDFDSENTSGRPRRPLNHPQKAECDIYTLADFPSVQCGGMDSEEDPPASEGIIRNVSVRIFKMVSLISPQNKINFKFLNINRIC
jgi:hypothetical protein